MMSLKGLNFLETKAWFYDEGERTLIMITDLCDHGELDDQIYKAIETGMRFEEATAKRVLAQIVNGLVTLLQKNIMHLDLKPANILVDSSGQVKIADFGLAVQNENANKGQAIGFRGTLRYMAPEMLQKALVDARGDVFSAAVIIYKMLELKMPFLPKKEDLEEARKKDPNLTEEELYVENAKNKDPNLMESIISQFMLNLNMLMLQKNPDMRLTAEEIWAHPSIKALVGEAPAQFMKDLLLTEQVTEESLKNRKLTGSDKLQFGTSTFMTLGKGSSLGHSIVKPNDMGKAVPTVDMLEKIQEEDEASDESEDETEQPRLVQISTQLRRVSIREVQGVDFVCSIKQVLDWTTKMLTRQRLNCVKHSMNANEICSLTFGFRNKNLSPEQGAYSAEPTEAFTLPRDKPLRKIQFEFGGGILRKLLLQGEELADSILTLGTSQSESL